MINMPPSTRRNQMLMLVFGTGLATGLHLGLLQAVFSASWKAPITFVVARAASRARHTALWRWIFPKLGGRTFGGQLVRQVVSPAGLHRRLLAVVGTHRRSPAASAVQVPTGSDLTITITPAMRPARRPLYVLLPILPVGLLSLIGYHLVWPGEACTASAS
jgi:hypothetical protein